MVSSLRPAAAGGSRRHRAAPAGQSARLVGFFHGEPFFEGTPATTWGQELNADGPPEKPAFEHLKKAGKAALPVVLELSLRKNSPGQEQALRAAYSAW